MILIIFAVIGLIIGFIMGTYIEERINISSFILGILVALLGMLIGMIVGAGICTYADTEIIETADVSIYTLTSTTDENGNILGSIYLEEEEDEKFKYVIYDETKGYTIERTCCNYIDFEITDEKPYVHIDTYNFKSEFVRFLVGDAHYHEYTFYLPAPAEEVVETID